MGVSGHLLTSGAAGEWDETAGAAGRLSGSLTLFWGQGVGCCHDGAKIKPRNNGFEKPYTGRSTGRDRVSSLGVISRDLRESRKLQVRLSRRITKPSAVVHSVLHDNQTWTDSFAGVRHWSPDISQRLS